MPRYLTVEQVKAYHRNEIPTDDDEWIEAAIDAAEATLDQACQRRFVVATTATARVYVPNSCDRLRIHDCTTVTAVSNDGTTVAGADYQLEPLNGLSWAGESRPYEEIVLKSGWWYVDGREATVSVTATWGWSAIPARIVQAALIVAKNVLLKRDEEKLQLIGLSDRDSTIVNEAIAHYRRVEAWGIG